MTSEEMEHAIEFLLEHHAKVSAEIGQLTEAVSVMRQEMEANRTEIRQAIDNLIIANETTRKLSEDVARLTIQNSQRITKLEEKAS
jgi:hypothetical protein